MKVINKRDENYPKALLNISNPPEKLFVLGNETILDNFGIANSRQVEIVRNMEKKLQNQLHIICQNIT